MLLPSGNPFKCHEEILSLQSIIPLKRYDIFPPDDWGMLRRSRYVQISINNGTFLGICLLFIPPLALLQKNRQASDWVGVR